MQKVKHYFHFFYFKCDLIGAPEESQLYRQEDFLAVALNPSSEVSFSTLCAYQYDRQLSKHF